MEKSEINGEKFVRRLRRQRHIGLSCDSLELLAPHHARLLARSGAAAFAAAFGRSTAGDAASGSAGASGAAATFLSMRVCRRSAASHGRLLASSGAAAFGRTGASGASQCALRRRVLPNPGSLAGDDDSAAR